MGRTEYNRPTLRGLFQAVVDLLPPWPSAELALMRHEPMDDNGELEFWGDMRYLQDLRAAIMDELREGAFLWELPVPVYSESLGDSCNQWPDDIAATQLACWREELDWGAA